MNNENYWSRMAKFHARSILDRRKALCALPLNISEQDFESLDHGLCLDIADVMSENVLGSFSLPFSVATNFLIDQKSCLVPMVSEEPSVVAAASKMAKIVGLAGGFFTKINKALIMGQLQIYNFSDVDAAFFILKEQKNNLKALLEDLCINMTKRGGGVVELNFRKLYSKTIGPMIIIEPLFDVIDAMGANLVNTVMEKFSYKISEFIKCEIGLRILSNLCDKRLAQASCTLPFRALATDKFGDNGHIIARKMIAAQAFAESDVYRACTHNKGILNGIDAVAIATGNDFRAIEAGAHAYASKSGVYAPLTTMHIDESAGLLHASLTLPLAIGVVGGSCNVHQGVRLAKKILGAFAKESRSLSSVIVSVGLAQCLAAIYALSSDGIQKGHMKLHQKRAQIFDGGKRE